jgi:hypothetical protein
MTVKKGTTTATAKAKSKPVKMDIDFTAIQIDNDIPIPQMVSGKSPMSGKILSLKVGQSFLVPSGSPDEAKKVRGNLMACTRRIAKQTGKEFLVAIMAEEKGVRVWRKEGEGDRVKDEAPAFIQQAPIVSTPQATSTLKTTPTHLPSIEIVSVDVVSNPVPTPGDPGGGDPWPTL